MRSPIIARRGNAVSEPAKGKSAVERTKKERESERHTLPSVERDEVERERELFELALRVALLESEATVAEDPTDERRRVGIRSSVERQLVGQRSQAVKHASNERAKRLRAVLGRNDLRIDASEDGDAESELRGSQPVRADVCQGLNNPKTHS